VEINTIYKIHGTYIKITKKYFCVCVCVPQKSTKLMIYSIYLFNIFINKAVKVRRLNVRKYKV
jgi:hypothetical protein